MEKKIALVPRVIMKGATGPKEYAVLLTDQRLIFVLEHASRAALVGVLGDALLSDKKVMDYEKEDPDRLAAEPGNVAVSHSAIHGIEIEKGFSSYTMSTMYTLLVDYTDSAGKSRKVKAFLQPSQKLVESKKSEGMNRKATTEEYAKTVRSSLEQSLPASIVQKGKWNV